MWKCLKDCMWKCLEEGGLLTPEEELSSSEFLNAKGTCHTADETKDDVDAVQEELLRGARDAHVFQDDRHLHIGSGFDLRLYDRSKRVRFVLEQHRVLR